MLDLPFLMNIFALPVKHKDYGVFYYTRNYYKYIWVG